MPRYPAELSQLILFLKKLPGVGGKTAERFSFQMLSWQTAELQALATLLAQLKEKITHCSECHCLCEQHQCLICSDRKRDRTQLCILASARDVFSLEETGTFKGLYHVLGGLLSPIDGKMPEHLHLDQLKTRIQSLPIQEVIIALDSTVEGDTTALFLKEQLQNWGLSVSRLAFGLPIGSSLDFVDGGTLARAFTGRHSF